MTSQHTDGSSTRRERAFTAAAVVLAAALLVALFLPILRVRWRYYDEQPRYSHCAMLPLVSAAWIWDRWDALRALPRSVSRGGVVAVLAGVLAFLYGRVVSNNFLQHAAMLATLGGAVAALCGARVLRACAFPLLYLVLTIPLPKAWDEIVTQPLQSGATRAAESVFDAFGWVVVRQGNVLQLPHLKLLVEEQCSGAHSLYALSALAIAWVFFVERPAWLRVVLVASTVPIAVLANAIRVSATGVLAYKVDPSYAQGVSHQTAGMIVFAIGVVLLLFVDWCLKPDPVPPRADAAA